MVKMNKVDIEIYRQIKPTKGLTEIYLGHVQFPWQYAIADYSADRTEGIPLMSSIRLFAEFSILTTH